MELEKKLQEEHTQFIEEAIEKGKKEGELNIPDTNDLSVSPYEKTVTAKYQALISDIGLSRDAALSSANEGIIKALRSEKGTITIESVGLEVDKITSIEEGELSKEKSTYLDGVREVQNAASFVSADSNKKLSDREFKKVTKIHGRSHTNKGSMKNWVVNLILVGIGLSEVAINYQVFKQFGENLIFTAIMALSLCLVVPLLAHKTGKMLKQWSDNKIGYSIMSFGFTAIIAGIFYKVASLRLKDPKVDIDSFYIFFGLALSLYLAGLIVSYFHFDSSEEFYNSYLDNKDNNEVFKKEDVRRATNLMVIKKVFTENQEKIRNTHEELRAKAKNKSLVLTQRINNTVEAHNRILLQYRNLEERCNNFYHESIQNYRTGNLSRRITLQPKVWATDLIDLKLNYLQFKNAE